MAQDLQDGRSPDALNGRLRLPITGTPAWPAFDQSLIAEIDLERARWAEITALTEMLTPGERLAPGYFSDPDWSARTSSLTSGCGSPKRETQLINIAANVRTSRTSSMPTAGTPTRSGGAQGRALGHRVDAGHRRPDLDAPGVVRTPRTARCRRPLGPQGRRGALRRAPRSTPSLGRRADRSANAATGRRAGPVITRAAAYVSIGGLRS